MIRTPYHVPIICKINLNSLTATQSNVIPSWGVLAEPLEGDSKKDQIGLPLGRGPEMKVKESAMVWGFGTIKV